MKIIGNGVDIVRNKRIEKSLKIDGFKKRIFTKYEITNSKKIKNKINYFAKRFAAKEAFVKAIGTGFRQSINFNDIEIKNNKQGKPINTSTKQQQQVCTYLNKLFIYLNVSNDLNHLNLKSMKQKALTSQ